MNKPISPATRWWLEHTSAGRRMQRRMLPESALSPLARREAREEREETERRLNSAYVAVCVRCRTRTTAERGKTIDLREPCACGGQLRRVR